MPCNEPIPNLWNTAICLNNPELFVDWTDQITRDRRTVAPYQIWVIKPSGCAVLSILWWRRSGRRPLCMAPWQTIESKCTPRLLNYEPLEIVGCGQERSAVCLIFLSFSYTDSLYTVPDVVILFPYLFVIPCHCNISNKEDRLNLKQAVTVEREGDGCWVNLVPTHDFSDYKTFCSAFRCFVLCFTFYRAPLPGLPVFHWNVPHFRLRHECGGAEGPWADKRL